jgi:hypothetical protein
MESHDRGIVLNGLESYRGFEQLIPVIGVKIKHYERMLAREINGWD